MYVFHVLYVCILYVRTLQYNINGSTSRHRTVLSCFALQPTRAHARRRIIDPVAELLGKRQGDGVRQDLYALRVRCYLGCAGSTVTGRDIAAVSLSG